ncbi:MAG: peroxiredoxin [Cyanobacteria bacterium HKST-UBA04]|nr:peroxiredoxin [Cyanobacteria bacterium HKST-UBA05]MCA9798213.1 peroxiredoxin [Cyanobacteria bacterium HKST-UBA04]
MIQVGKAAPEFTAQAVVDGQIKEVTLNQYKGKWVVLFFYPLDFTFVCPTEIQGFDAQFAEFEKANAQILGISVDSVYSHLDWMKDLGQLKFPLLSDITKRISREYGVLKEDAGISFRGTFLIDPDGVLRSYVVNDLNVGRNVEETLRLVQAFQTGELCQVGWKPGQQTLGAAG